MPANGRFEEGAAAGPEDATIARVRHGRRIQLRLNIDRLIMTPDLLHKSIARLFEPQLTDESIEPVTRTSTSPRKQPRLNRALICGDKKDWNF